MKSQRVNREGRRHEINYQCRTGTNDFLFKNLLIRILAFTRYEISLISTVQQWVSASNFSPQSNSIFTANQPQNELILIPQSRFHFAHSPFAPRMLVISFEPTFFIVERKILHIWVRRAFLFLGHKIDRKFAAFFFYFLCFARKCDDAGGALDRTYSWVLGFFLIRRARRRS